MARPRIANKRHRLEHLRRKYDLAVVGSVSQHMTEDRAAWLARNMPENMTISEFLCEALLDDAMSEDAA